MDPISYQQTLVDYQNQIKELQASTEKTSQIAEPTQTFGSHLSDAIAGLSQNMQIMDENTVNVIAGEENDLAKVMVQMTETQLSLQTAVQIRNKCLEAYNDLKNMQF